MGTASKVPVVAVTDRAIRTVVAEFGAIRQGTHCNGSTAIDLDHVEKGIIEHELVLERSPAVPWIESITTATPATAALTELAPEE